MESRLGVKPKFRYPFFRPLMWHAASQLATGMPLLKPELKQATCHVQPHVLNL